MSIATKTYDFSDPMAASLGLAQLRLTGLTTRGVLFIALDARGAVHIAVPEHMTEVTRIKVGEKLALASPFAGRGFHFDSIHRLSGHGVLWNGDRRLAQPGTASELAVAVAEWLRGGGARDMFLGVTPHHPGSWWTLSATSKAIALHDRGFVDVVTTKVGLVARRQGEPHLYHLPFSKLALLGPLEGWTPVFTAPLGNVVMLERRVLADRLVVTCERGLVEVDLAALPEVHATAVVELGSGFGVVGRIDGGAFAVTCGTLSEWGLIDMQPALLCGARGDTLRDLAGSLRPRP